ncbi:MAG TPA: hypothetical protein PK018_07935 [Candidatus Competibacter sp.]|nr:hypothetical protein [Candidatus Competibacteraceae bacterium]HPE72083.1 hypothetical protein [Candidatus Competibacter sp.]HRW66018.1 hypothetical protein [Candidatus Competibacter sp.]
MSTKFKKIDTAVIFLLIFMLLKFLLVMTSPVSNQLIGDANDYVPKARYFLQYKSFQKIANNDSSQTDLRYSDFRPPGYPIFLSSLLVFGEENSDIYRSVRIIQFFLDAAVIILIFFAACSFNDSNKFRIFPAIVLGAQPWTSAFITVINPDTLVCFLVVLCLIALALFVSNDKKM